MSSKTARLPGLTIYVAALVRAADQRRTCKLHQTSGKMTSGSDVAYRAICTNIIAGSHAAIWTGPKCPEKERALREVLLHNKEYPGHDATIEH